MRIEISQSYIKAMVLKRVSEEVIDDITTRVESALKLRPELRMQIAKRIVRDLEPKIAKKVLKKLGVKI